MDMAIQGVNQTIVDGMKVSEVRKSKVVQPDWESELPDKPMDEYESLQNIKAELEGVGIKTRREPDSRATKFVKEFYQEYVDKEPQ